VATLAFVEPNYVGNAGFTSPIVQTYVPAQLAAFRRGDLLQLITTGTIQAPPATTSGGTGALAGVAGPTASAVTFSTTASAGAAAQTYFYVFTYANSAGTTESAPSQEFIYSVPAGYKPTVTVSATGAPSGATNYQVYTSVLPQQEVLQNTYTAPTALGTAYTVTVPLANNIGVNRGSTNMNTNIAGMAINSSAAVYYSGPGGSFSVNEQSPLGATNSYPPLEPAEIFMIPVIKLSYGTTLEMSLRQPLYQPVFGNATAGLYLDPITGFWVADTSQSNKVLNILQASPGVPSIQGNVGDIGARVRVQFNAGVL